MDERKDWKLTEAKPVGPDGVIVLTYERDRDREAGKS